MEKKFAALLRVLLGWTFFWPFLDKLFGLGFSTKPGKSWLDGVSPTMGFLSHSTGPFASIFHSLAGQGWVEWMFMLGLCLIGLSLILGIGLKIAGYSGALMLALMFLAASLPPAQNPIIDEHIIYLVTLLWFASNPSVGDTWGLGRRWKSLAMVKKNPWLV